MTWNVTKAMHAREHHDLERPKISLSNTCLTSVQAQLIDYVVGRQEHSVVANVPVHFDIVTDSHGIAELWLPPTAEARVMCVPKPTLADAERHFKLDESQRLIIVSHRKEQFVAFELHESARLAVTVRAFDSGEAVEGVRVCCRMIQDERGEAVPAATCDSLLTGRDGHTPWFRGRAGTFVQAEIVDLPHEYLHLEYMAHVMDQLQCLRLTGSHELQWQVPRKPRVLIHVRDATSGERVVGVQYRVMVQPHTPPTAQPRVSLDAARVLDMPAEVRALPSSLPFLHMLVVAVLVLTSSWVHHSALSTTQ
jgi:hypothetical protein